MREITDRFDAILYRVFDFEVKVPELLRAPYRGSVFLLGMFLGIRGKLLFLAVTVALVAQLGPLQGPLLFLTILAISLLVGAAAGAVYGVLHPLCHVGDVGVWLRWALPIFVYLSGIFLFWRHGPMTIDDPAFLWLAVGCSSIAALGLVLTDDRGAKRLSPHQFRHLQNKVLMRAAPRRMWAAMKRKRAGIEARRKTLESTLARRPAALPALRALLSDLRSDLTHIRKGLEVAERHHPGIDPDDLADVDAWIERVDRQLGALP